MSQNRSDRDGTPFDGDRSITGRNALRSVGVLSLDGRGRVTIPAGERRELGLEKDDRVYVAVRPLDGRDRDAGGGLSYRD